MATFSVPAEHCWAPHDIGWVDPPEAGGVRRHGTTYCLTQRGNVYPLRPAPYRRGRTEQQRWWRTHPAEAQAIADDAEVTVASLLCPGCRKMHARLVRAGDWP